RPPSGASLAGTGCLHRDEARAQGDEAAAAAPSPCHPVSLYWRVPSRGRILPVNLGHVRSSSRVLTVGPPHGRPPAIRSSHTSPRDTHMRILPASSAIFLVAALVGAAPSHVDAQQAAAAGPRRFFVGVGAGVGRTAEPQRNVAHVSP